MDVRECGQFRLFSPEELDSMEGEGYEFTGRVPMDEEDEPVLIEVCPNCRVRYDEIDYEYQMCHLCGHDPDTDILE